MVSSTRRTAGCGPACPVVWQGRVGDHSPYADLSLFLEGEFQPDLCLPSASCAVRPYHF
jgi:hypothetical protein